MAKIIVNGAPQDTGDHLSVAELIKDNHVPQPEMVAVQVNGQFIERTDYASTRLKNGDTVDFLYFMGGGQPHV